MSLADWFKAREERRYTAANGEGSKTEVPDGVWSNCPSCKHVIYEGELVTNLRCCPYCGHHFRVTAHERLEILVDPDSFEEFDAGLISLDPLEFSAAKSYPDSIAAARKNSDLKEAVVVGRATIGGHPVVVGVMDFRFIAATMGSVVGEKITRVFKTATDERRGVLLVTASGGARMQEGMLSLMQMAKTSAAADRFAATHLPYISILTDPTTGGVTASFAVLADVIFAEPGALVGFAGPRVIEQTTRQKLPKDAQSSEMLVQQGMVDAVVARWELCDEVTLAFDHLMGMGESA